MEREFGPVIVGEWSLATDNCAMWLNGFNDNLPGFPRLPCKYIPCSEPYMGQGVQPGAPPDPTKPYQAAAIAGVRRDRSVLLSAAKLAGAIGMVRVPGNEGPPPRCSGDLLFLVAVVVALLLLPRLGPLRTP